MRQCQKLGMILFRALKVEVKNCYFITKWSAKFLNEKKNQLSLEALFDRAALH